MHSSAQIKAILREPSCTYFICQISLKPQIRDDFGVSILTRLSPFQDVSSLKPVFGAAGVSWVKGQLTSFNLPQKPRLKP